LSDILHGYIYVWIVSLHWNYLYLKLFHCQCLMILSTSSWSTFHLSILFESTSLDKFLGDFEESTMNPKPWLAISALSTTCFFILKMSIIIYMPLIPNPYTVIYIRGPPYGAKWDPIKNILPPPYIVYQLVIFFGCAYFFAIEYNPYTFPPRKGYQMISCGRW